MSFAKILTRLVHTPFYFHFPAVKKALALRLKGKVSRDIVRTFLFLCRYSPGKFDICMATSRTWILTIANSNFKRLKLLLLDKYIFFFLLIVPLSPQNCTLDE